MKKRVLAISGKRYSGKDTFARDLALAAQRRGLTVHTHAFALESKRMFVLHERREHGVEVDLDRLQNDRAYKETWRPKLTELTTTSIARDPLVFCRAVADRIASEDAIALVTDMRLRLEVEHFRSRFELHLVRLTRRDEERAKSGFVYDAKADTHYTETDLDDASLWNEVVTNDGSLDELAEKAAAVLERWLSKTNAGGMP